MRRLFALPLRPGNHQFGAHSLRAPLRTLGELTNAIRQDARRLFGQIERGLAVEFRVAPKSDGDAENREALETITNLCKEMHSPQMANEPLLLGSGEILEGESQTAKHSRKTTTHKTTISQKESHKESKSEPKE